MFFIPGWLIELITFPGVIMHEIAHRIFCHITGTPVYDVRYYKFNGQPSGYVIHGHPKDLKAAFLISAGPLIVNTVMCSILSFAAVLPLMVLDDERPDLALGILLWLGVSMGMHALPSNHDAREFSLQVRDARGNGPLLWAAKLFQGLLTLANLLRVVWFDLIYAVGVAAALPILFGLF